MNIDIKPIENNQIGYRGLDRLLNVERFNVDKGFNQLIKMYFDYISYLLEYNDSNDTFYKILPFYYFLVEKGAKCEMIISDKEPVNDFCGNKVEFLGIDIVNQYFDSLLLEPTVDLSETLLNKNMLCKQIEYYPEIISNLGEYQLPEHEWEPQYVYKVIC